MFTTRECGDNILIMILVTSFGLRAALESVESPWSPDDGNCKDAEGQVLVMSFIGPILTHQHGEE